MKQNKKNPMARAHSHTRTMRVARGMRVVETRCPAFENEFKHIEARVTEVSGSMNFGDKFHEVHFAWRCVRARAHVCTFAHSKRVSYCTENPETTKQFEWESPFRFVAFDSMSRSIEITSSFHAQIRSLVA